MNEMTDIEVMSPAQPKEMSDEEVMGRPPTPNVPFSGGEISDITKTNPTGYFGGIAKAFKSGAEDAYQGDLGLSEADKKWVRDKTGPSFNGFNEGFLFPAIARLDSIARTPASMLHAIGDAAMAAGMPRDFVSLLEGEAFYGSPHPTGMFAKPSIPRSMDKVPLTEAQKLAGFTKDTSPYKMAMDAHDLEIIGPKRPEPVITDSPRTLAEQAVPRGLSSEATEAGQSKPGHAPGEYDARGKEWVSKIDDSDSAKAAIEKIAMDNDFFPEARGGEVSSAAKDAVAKAAGVEAGLIDSDYFSTAFDNDGKVRAVIQVLRQTTKDFVEASEKAAKEPSVENSAAATEVELRHSHVVEYTLGLRAESGRSLAAWKDLLRQTEETRAGIAVRAGEATGDVPTGVSNIIKEAGEVQADLNVAGKKPSLGKMIAAAEKLLGFERSRPPGKPMAPEVQGLMGAAREVTNKFGLQGATELDAFKQSLTQLSKGEGHLGDTVEAARALIEKVKPKVTDKPKVASEKGKLVGAARKLVQAVDGAKEKTPLLVSSEMKALMETARQAVGRLKNIAAGDKIAAFREAVLKNDTDAAVKAANELVKSRTASEPKPLVEHEAIIAAARKVAQAAQEKGTTAPKDLPPDIVELLTGAKNAASDLQSAHETELSRLVDAAEKQAANMTKQKSVSKPTEALPPELQALVNKTQRVVKSFGGIERGERAALLLARTGRTAEEQEQLARSVIGLTPNQVARVLDKVRTSEMSKQPGWFYWLWQQGLISGLVTHTKYLAVNTGTVFLERVISPTLSAALGKARGQDVSVMAPIYSNVAMIHSLPDAFASAAQAFKTGMRVPLESELNLFRRGEESPQTKGSGAAYARTPSPDWGVWKRVFNEDQLATAAKVLGVPGRSANMIHTFYKVLSERASQSAQAYEAAFQEKVSKDKFWDRYQYHLDNPSDTALRTAVNDAYSGAFMSKLGGKTSEWAATLTNNPVLKWAFPFQHIPWNIARMTAEYTPLAVLGPEMRSAILGEKGVPAQNLAIAKMTVGSSIIGYFIHQAMSGNATGDYPHDPKERDRWTLLHLQPNSITIGNQQVSTDRLGPAGNLIRAGINIGQIIKNYNGEDDNAMVSAMWSASVAAANLVGDEVGFQTLRNIFEAMGNEKKVQTFLAAQAGTFVPMSSLLGQGASATDPYMRKAEGIIDGLKYKVPGLRETLPVKRDPLYGNPRDNPGYLSLVRKSFINTNPVRSEMARLQIGVTPIPDRIENVKLTPEMHDRLQAAAGVLTEHALEGLVHAQDWSQKSDYFKEMAIRGTIEATRSMAKDTFFAANFDTILPAAIKQKVDHINGITHTDRPKNSPLQ